MTGVVGRRRVLVGHAVEVWLPGEVFAERSALFSVDADGLLVQLLGTVGVQTFADVGCVDAAGRVSQAVERGRELFEKVRAEHVKWKPAFEGEGPPEFAQLRGVLVGLCRLANVCEALPYGVLRLIEL